MSSYNNWRGPIATGLVNDPDGKHIKRMGQAIWLFVYLACRVDSKTGKTKNPTRYSEISERMGKSVSTIRRWREILVSHNYIEIERRAHGFSVQILKWKTFKKRASTGRTNEYRLPKNEHSQGRERLHENEHSRVHENEHSQGERVSILSTKSAPKWTFTPKNGNGNHQKHNDLEGRPNSLKEVKEVLLSKEGGFSLIGVTPEGESPTAEKGGDDAWFE